VLLPLLASRIEQFGDTIRFQIDTSKVSTLVEIAVYASKREIIEVISAAVNLWDDVLNVKHGKR
jgi:hypothetical protein